MRFEEELGSADAVCVRRAIHTSLADNTRRAYRSGWQQFVGFCTQHELNPMKATPGNVAEFLVAMATPRRLTPAGGRADRPLARGTIRICLAAINRTYSEQNLESPARHPLVRMVFRGLGRHSDARPRQVKALSEHEVATVLAECDRLAVQEKQRAIATRDAAVIAVGFGGALRRSEICQLQMVDVEFVPSADDPVGMYLHIRRSKTDQYGAGQAVAVPGGTRIRPAERLQRWLALSGERDGPLFQTLWRGGQPRGRPLHPTDVARLVKRHVEAVGLDPADYSGHSLRAGFVTSAAAHSARLDKIMEVTRHRSPAMVLRYIRQADAFEDHAGADFL